MYCKNSNNSNTRKTAVIYPNVLTMWFYLRVMPPKDADKMANSVEPDQTAPA